MTMERIRERLHARPFEPFTIHLADGRSVLVQHPDFIAAAPSGRTLSVYQPDDSHHIIDVLLVTDLETRPDTPSSN
jgi:hypothetical protein